MGKIKSKLIKGTANTLAKRGIKFTEKFEENKRILEKTMPSKKIRNQVAGYLAKLKRYEKAKEERLNAN